MKANVRAVRHKNIDGKEIPYIIIEDDKGETILRMQVGTRSIEAIEKHEGYGIVDGKEIGIIIKKKKENEMDK